MLVRVGWVVLCGLLPIAAVWYAVAPVAIGDRQAADFHYNYYYAAEAIRAGEDFYPTDGFIVRGPDDLIIDYVYPPLLAVATVPWTLMPIGLAEVLFQILLVAAFVATLAVLGVRDWRCYGLAFLWPPVTDAITTGNVTILLGLVAALAWRYRDRPLAAGGSIGISVATKLFVWPLAIWLAASRRISAAVWSVVIAAAAVLTSWAIVGFRGIADYPDLARRLSDRMDERGYTIYALGVDIGLSPAVARAAWVTLAVALLVATVATARRGDDRRAFVLALAASLAFSPIVWLHYFALLLVAVAVAHPRLGVIWFIGLPLQLAVTTGVYNGSTFQTVAVLAAATVTVGLAMRRPEEGARPALLSSPAAARS